TLPVSSDTPKPDTTWGEKIRAVIASLPRADPLWNISASHNEKNVTLTVVPTSPTAVAPKDPHFFSIDNYVAYEQPQTVKADGRGGFVLTLPIAQEADKSAKKLVGVLTSENGWLPNGALRGLRVEADFAPGSAIANPTPQATGVDATAAKSTLLGTLA